MFSEKFAIIKVAWNDFKGDFMLHHKYFNVRNGITTTKNSKKSALCLPNTKTARVY